jgi:23S rRNA G2069 N7-methylase RlmK/C1962 C5-methylase RlmI
MLANRVKKRLKHLQKWAKRCGFEAFRLYDRDIPEIPLVLDLYGGAVSGALYKRPYEKDPAEEAVWLESMKEALSQSLGIAPELVIIKQREKKRGGDQYEKAADRGLTREIREGQYKFKVNLSDYLDTGLFLDRRALRALVSADAGGKRILNLFCYTASFSVYAAGGGAVSTDSVDLSNTYLNWARENFALNGFKAKFMQKEAFFAQNGHSNPTGSVKKVAYSEENSPTTGINIIAHRLIHADVNAFLELALASRYTWDSIILDPPAFSNSKMARADFDLQRDYGALLADCLRLLSPNGKLWFSANARSFRANAADLEKALAAKVVDITDKIVDEDFRGKKAPKTFLISLTEAQKTRSVGACGAVPLQFLSQRRKGR